MNLVKLSVSLLTLVSSIAFAAPSAQDFEKVANQAQAFGYHGYDVTICYSGQTMVLGGVSFWNAPLQIYLQNYNGAITPTRNVTGDMHAPVQKYVLGNGEEMTLVMGERAGAEGGVQAHMTMGSREIAQVLSCFFQNSGLETPAGN